MRPILRGAVAGSVATIFMSVLMLAGQRGGLVGQLPPEKITSSLLRKLGRHPNKGERKFMASLAHVGFGAAGGAGFALLRRRGPVGLVILQGVAWATGIWAVSYLGWVPALGIMPPADKDRPGRPEVMVAAHWLYGATLGLLLR